MQTPAIPIHPIHAWIFPVALVYSTLHRLYLKGRFQSPKWAAEEARRAGALGVAVSRLAMCTRANQFSGVDAEIVERGLLSAMLSEVESIVVDSHGIYLNVNLLIEDRNNPARMFCLNRANLDREPHKTYPKDQMVAWQAMQSQNLVYEPSFKSAGGAEKPYRSILAIPILLRDGDVTTSLGAVSIDSQKDDEFQGLEAKVERRLLPYVTLLKLVLVYRSKYNAFP
jgi:hypothetical protein